MTTRTEEPGLRSRRAEQHPRQPVAGGEGAAVADKKAEATARRKEWTWIPDATEAEAPVTQVGPGQWRTQVGELTRVLAWARVLGGW